MSLCNFSIRADSKHLYFARYNAPSWCEGVLYMCKFWTYYRDEKIKPQVNVPACGRQLSHTMADWRASPACHTHSVEGWSEHVWIWILFFSQSVLNSWVLKIWEVHLQTNCFCTWDVWIYHIQHLLLHDPIHSCSSVLPKGQSSKMRRRFNLGKHNYTYNSSIVRPRNEFFQKKKRSMEIPSSTGFHSAAF